LLGDGPKERPYREALQRTLLDDLCRRSATTVWFLVPLLFLFREIIRRAYDAEPGVKWAFWSTLAIVGIRWGLVLHHRRRPPSGPAVVRGRHRRFLVASTVIGLGLAAMIALAAPQLDFPQLAAVAVFLTGVHSVALGSMAASPPTYVSFVTPALVALVWSFESLPREPLRDLMLAMIVLYVPSLVLMCLYIHYGLRRTIVLGLELRDLALKDVLTGLPNRRFLTEFAEREAAHILRSWRTAAPDQRWTVAGCRTVGLLVLDIDFFKSVNDEHGHAAGDEVLRQCAQVVEEAVRKPDLVVRWGGEEFVVAARDVDRDAAWDLAERIRRRIEEHPFRLAAGDVVRRTGSVGFALFPFSTEAPDALGWEQVLALADRALYQAKARGRNRVVGLLNGGIEADSGERVVKAVNDDLEGALARGWIRMVATPRASALSGDSADAVAGHP
jgi:diguanylate cyclase (GGDEF)-like protein